LEVEMSEKTGSEHKNFLLHKNDLVNTLYLLKAAGQTFENSGYFLDLALKFSLETPQKGRLTKVGIIGLNVPEELIYGVGAEPLWILGGSFGAALHADPLVPRDTDSVSKATLGYLSSDIFRFTQNIDLLVVPIVSDSMRKIAEFLAREREVFPVDLPPLQSDPGSPRKWLTQMYELRRLLERKTKVRLTLNRLRDAVERVNQAKAQMKRFITYSASHPELISGAWVMLILNSYYFTADLPEWTARLELLNRELVAKIKQIRNFTSYSRPRVLLAGSPVFFPNFKIPLLMQELNLALIAYAQEMTKRIEIMPDLPKKGEKLEKYFAALVNRSYLEDCSAAYVSGGNRLEHIIALENSLPLNGVIYHVLKGQIEYDFELDGCEQYFQRKDIPFFRLETDYHGQDIEQLKIRLEAFMEMMENKYQLKRA
jgi:benzoyl-CoA reductase/2-hydroxyglutaryl-CoA dehydratase subunit BcrC/BadD/HgdB